MKDTLYMLGKMLELSAMILLVFALAVGLSQEHGMGKELTLLAIGSAVFFAGYLLERWASGGAS
ncbi:MAG: hypothetical protein HY303_20435 [Candidatus Wallbacteria bacterium]|nr:hypothetical protein [Candidatus Wallbacteria bacterium]